MPKQTEFPSPFFTADNMVGLDMGNWPFFYLAFKDVSPWRIRINITIWKPEQTIGNRKLEASSFSFKKTSAIKLQRASARSLIFKSARILSACLNPWKTRSIWLELNWRCGGKLRLEGNGQWRALLCSSGCIYIRDASWRRKQQRESMNNELICWRPFT